MLYSNLSPSDRTMSACKGSTPGLPGFPIPDGPNMKGQEC